MDTNRIKKSIDKISDSVYILVGGASAIVLILVCGFGVDFIRIRPYYAAVMGVLALVLIIKWLSRLSPWSPRPK